MMKRILPLRNAILNYSWGSRQWLAEFQGRPAPSPEPEAELWMGAHPKNPSAVAVGGRWVPLPTLVAEHAVELLGVDTAARFGNRLPFLFKILAAQRPLSLQAHPDRERAEVGFAAENAQGLPLDSPERNYRDGNAKPEILCALTEFQALCGFRSVAEIRGLLRAIDVPATASALGCLEAEDEGQGLEALFHRLSGLGRKQVEAIVSAVGARLERQAMPAAEAGWVRQLAAEYPGDAGALAPLYLNLLQLQPGEAIFLGPGVLHSYLSGTGVELMANSDNVLRAGLTAKHRDLAELRNVVRFNPYGEGKVRPRQRRPGEWVYPTPAREFQLSRLEIAPDRPLLADGGSVVAIVVCWEGSGQLSAQSAGEPVAFARGDSFLIPAAMGGYRLEGRGVLFRASVPVGGALVPPTGCQLGGKSGTRWAS